MRTMMNDYEKLSLHYYGERLHNKGGATRTKKNDKKNTEIGLELLSGLTISKNHQHNYILYIYIVIYIKQTQAFT